jgi:hypothetical protein
MCNTLRRLACAAWIAAAACSDGSDLSSVVNQNAAQEPAPGALSPEGLAPDGVSSSGVTPSAGSPASAPQAPAGPSGEPGGPVQPPAPNGAPAAASGEEAEPSATETNFFSARCQQDGDCGQTRRCELPADAGSARAAVDAGSDAAPPDAPPAGGRCVAL